MEYKGRGLHNAKFLKSFTEGKLKGLLDLVKKDDDLVFQIRNNYVNIYYKGGNIAKIESENSIQFNENYLLNRTIGEDARENERKAHLTK